MSNMVKELRNKTNEELYDLVIKCKEQLLQIRFNIANGETEKPHTISELKKTIARLLTILNERKINASKTEGKSTVKQATNKKTSTKNKSSTSSTKKSVKKGSK